MPSPSSSSQLTVTRPDLAGSMEEFDVEMNMNRMIALRVFPVIEVPEQAGQYGKIPLEELMKTVDTQRASGGGYSRSQFRFTKENWATEEHGHEVPVDDRNSAIYRDWFDAEMVSAKLARSKVAINYEKRIADILQNTTTFTPTAVATEWDTSATAKPIDDVEARVQALYDKGIVANALIITWKVFRNLRNVEQVIDRVASSGAGDPTKPTDITTAMLAQVFDLPNIIVGGAQYNSANEGQTASLSPIWDDEYAIVTRVCQPNDPIVEPCVGRTFHWGEDGSQIGGLMESYFSDDRRAEIVRNRMDTDEKVHYTEAVELLSNITT